LSINAAPGHRPATSDGSRLTSSANRVLQCPLAISSTHCGRRCVSSEIETVFFCTGSRNLAACPHRTPDAVSRPPVDPGGPRPDVCDRGGAAGAGSQVPAPVQKKTVSISLDTQRRPQCVLLMGRWALVRRDCGRGEPRMPVGVAAVAWSRVYAQEGSIPYRLWTRYCARLVTGSMAAPGVERVAQASSSRSVRYYPNCKKYLPPMSSYTPSPTPEQEQLRLWEAARELLTLIQREHRPCSSRSMTCNVRWQQLRLLAYLARRVQNHPSSSSVPVAITNLPPTIPCAHC